MKFGLCTCLVTLFNIAYEWITLLAFQNLAGPTYCVCVRGVSECACMDMHECMLCVSVCRRVLCKVFLKYTLVELDIICNNS